MKTLVDVYLEDYPTQARKKNPNNNCVNGPCPSCGGDDRFIVWFDHDEYFCRQCGIKGNLIEYMIQFHNMTVAEACKYVDYKDGSLTFNKANKNQTTAKTVTATTQQPANYIKQAIYSGLPNDTLRLAIFESKHEAEIAYENAYGCITCIATEGASNTLDGAAMDLVRKAPYVFLCYNDTETGKVALTTWARQCIQAGKILDKDLFIAPILCAMSQEWVDKAVWANIKT